MVYMHLSTNLLSYAGNIKFPPHCIVQYWFESGHEHKVQVKLHGNSKRRKQSFCRTLPSTIIALKEEAQKHTPKPAVNAVYERSGGIMNASSLGMLPRNREQVANLRCGSEISGTSICSNKSARDTLFMVMEQSKIYESGDKFVHVVIAISEPMRILATDQQLADLVHFSTNYNYFCVLSIDPTFYLGDFNVTCIAY